MAKNSALHFFLRCLEDAPFRKQLTTHNGYESFCGAVKGAGYEFTKSEAAAVIQEMELYAETEEYRENLDSILAWYAMQTNEQTSVSETCRSCSLRSQCGI